MKIQASTWQGIAIIGLFGLIISIIVWNAWLAPSETQVLARPIEFAIFLIPLAFLTRGLFAGSTSVHAYASFASLFYIGFGFWYVFTPLEEVYGAAMLIFSFMLYLGGFMYAKKTMVKPPNKKKK